MLDDSLDIITFKSAIVKLIMIPITILIYILTNYLQKYIYYVSNLLIMTQDTKDDVFEALKNRNLKVTDIGNVLGKSRQSIYNYVGAYTDSRQGSIPAFLHRLFSMCISTDVSQDEIDAFWTAHTEKIRDVLNDIDNVSKDLVELQQQLDDLRINGTSGNDDSVVKQQIVTLEKLDTDARTLSVLHDRLREERNILLCRPMSDFDPNVADRINKLSGPMWRGMDVGTVCVAKSGDYMVIVDPESNLDADETKLKLFTTVDGEPVLLKTMYFEKGSNMIQFSLIPQLAYRFEVIQITGNNVSTSGVLELKNYI